MARITEEAKKHCRKRLLETAARHFARGGIEDANVDRISVDAGFAKGTIYNYFSSKEELFATVVEQSSHRAVERFMAVDIRGSVRERLTALAAADVSVLREQEDFAKVLLREALSFRRSTYSLVVDHLGSYVAKVAEVLATGTEAGEVRRDKPVPQLALVFVGMLSLFYVQHWGSGGVWPALDDVPALAVTLFLDGAANPAPIEASPQNCQKETSL